MPSLVVGKDVARRPVWPDILKKYSVLAAKKSVSSVNRGNNRGCGQVGRSYATYQLQERCVGHIRETCGGETTVLMARHCGEHAGPCVDVPWRHSRTLLSLVGQLNRNRYLPQQILISLIV